MHYILESKQAIPTDALTWARWFEANRETRIVKQGTLPNGLFVSTVFLGLNHRFGPGPPLLFETMVFPREGEYDELGTDRYSTWVEAEEGHAKMVHKWRRRKARAKS